MTAQLKRIRWQAEFFKAVLPPDAGDFPSIGARGCFLSHLEVLKMARACGAGRLILMEDDLNFSGEFWPGWQRIEAFLADADCRIFYPAHTMPEQSGGIRRLDPQEHFACTHFMVFDRAGIEICINGLEEILSRPARHPDGGPMHVDGAYATLRRQSPELITFAHFPSLGYQRASRSDIAGDHWIDRYPTAAKLARSAKRVKAHYSSLLKRRKT